MSPTPAVAPVAARLAEAGVASPEVDARLLIEHAAVTGTDLEPLIHRRAAREPLQHITGTAYFRYLRLEVGPGVFVPRPETELLVDAAVAMLPPGGSRTVVDLGAGSGAIGLSIATETPDVHVHLVESDPSALRWLRRNVDRIARAAPLPVTVHEADLAEFTLPVAVDVVVANPPYLPDGTAVDAETAGYEPPVALWGGADGLDVIRRVIATAARLLAPGGGLVIEHDCTHDLSGLLGAGWGDVRRHRDLTGRWRYTTATLDVCRSEA